jgi:hypothetical protein
VEKDWNESKNDKTRIPLLIEVDCDQLAAIASVPLLQDSSNCISGIALDLFTDVITRDRPKRVARRGGTGRRSLKRHNIGKILEHPISSSVFVMHCNNCN